MPHPNAICRTCGNKYFKCLSCDGKVFKWKNVACSPECFQIYVSKVLEGRESKNE